MLFSPADRLTTYGLFRGKRSDMPSRPVGFIQCPDRVGLYVSETQLGCEEPHPKLTPQNDCAWLLKAP